MTLLSLIFHIQINRTSYFFVLNDLFNFLLVSTLLHLCTPLYYPHSGPRIIFQRWEFDRAHIRLQKLECYQIRTCIHWFTSDFKRWLSLCFCIRNPRARTISPQIYLCNLSKSATGFSHVLFLCSWRLSQECFTFSQIHQLAMAVFSVAWVRCLTPQRPSYTESLIVKTSQNGVVSPFLTFPTIPRRIVKITWG